MIDPIKRQFWYQAYLLEGILIAPSSSQLISVQEWARSMSLIAEQFMPFDESDNFVMERRE